MGHARLSPSGSSTWLACPGSPGLCDKIEKSESYNVYAEEGTAAHELGERGLKSHKRSSEFLGEILNVCETNRPEGFVVDGEMVEHIQNYMDYVYQVVDPHNDIIEIEKQVKLFYAPDDTGTSDVIAIDVARKILHVIDLKYGQGVKVEVKGNPQLTIYGISALDEVLEDGFYEIDSVAIHVVQPRLNHYESALYSIAELAEFREIVLETVKEINEGSKRFVPGEKQCRWCDASGICEAQARSHVETLTKDFDNLDKPSLNVELLTAGKLASILAKKSEVSKWMDAVESICYNRLERGLEVPGFKLVEGRSNRQWVDEVEAEKFLRDRLKIDEVYTKKMISPTQAEKALKGMTSRSQTRFDAIVCKPPGKPTIASEDDKRPSLTRVSEMFENLETEIDL